MKTKEGFVIQTGDNEYLSIGPNTAINRDYIVIGDLAEAIVYYYKPNITKIVEPICKRGSYIDTTTWRIRKVNITEIIEVEEE